jgi:Putative peptidoglycan binding domain/Transglycosylase SLT domain
MPDFSRNLSFQSPLMRGADVLALQRALHSLGIGTVEADGLYGAQTAAAVVDFQHTNGLPATGMVDSRTWATLFGSPAAVVPASRDVAVIAARLKQQQQFRDSTTWRLGGNGIEIGGQPAVGTPGEPVTVREIIKNFGQAITDACNDRQVPVEIVIATIAVESHGDPEARREEPRWTSDDATPDRVSLGLMQTLISTARDVLKNPTIDGQWLLDPKNSIEAGTGYISSQYQLTGFDPPKVGCAYNAGGLYYDSSPTNRWRMRQYPIGTGTYADRLVAYFNDCFSILMKDANQLPGPSLADGYKKSPAMS